MNNSNFKVPKKLENLPDSMIRMMTIEANRHGAINMGQGCPEFDPPPEIIEMARTEVLNGSSNQYSEDRGMKSLREEISAKYGRFYNWTPDPETEITVTCGVTEAIMTAVFATVEAGDKVVIIEPAHENYLAAVTFVGAIPVWIALDSPKFCLDSDKIEEAFKNGARHIILNTPHNPTGRVFNKDELQTFSLLCQKYNVRVITDEIYEHIIYDGNGHIQMARLDGMGERTITTSGIGKTYSLTGWRIGYVIAPKDITTHIRKIHTYLTICAPSPLQAATVAALRLPRDYYHELVNRYHLSRSRIMEILDQSGFRAYPPEGAYYVMADFSDVSKASDLDFCMELVMTKKVAVIPGSSFYSNKEHGRKLVRFAFPKPISIINEVGQRLANHP